MIPVELDVHMMEPFVLHLSMARAACLIACTLSSRLIEIRCFTCSMSRLVMLLAMPPMPALLNSMSSLHFLRS
ncbi:hypothetical protein ES332_D04G208200v1 [Gossypium tomentosum]|uniref:Uncharacterized protein n=1 Tax=Gossypium tomentosum TaxID=34277 RepID=A0A5D2LGS7_GOSTO|nr:hypothetical protein ES332_D04G208200v1 [Gossypium tomentosum]